MSALFGKEITIENRYIKKSLTVKGKRIVSSEIDNKISERTLASENGSQEFVLSFKNGCFKSKICASDLDIKNSELTTENGVSKLRIDFKAFSYKKSKILLSLVYTLKENDPFIKKHLEFSFKKIGQKEIILDYIDFERFAFDEKLMHWSVPKQKNSHIPGFALRLGQPVYVDSLYFGCEFPLCLNLGEKGVTSLKYYSGKNLTSLIGDGVYKTYEAVVGASEGAVFAQVQKAFFEYIRTVSKPCKFRRQYNSWYDNMLNITKENVTSSFLEIDKGLTKYGEPAVDSFVADDGWNDYSKGFWGFNEKFPDGLTAFTNLSESFGSRFGLWLGPRGGYTTDTPKFAKQIEKAGNGYLNKSSMDICVASQKYAEKTGQLLLDFMKDYRLNYFKLDGFAQRPCKNKNHDHMTGGYKQMYFYTDIWEKWIKVFETLSDNAVNDLWINLTCYAPPSAWFLKWVNSVWMQISNDVGFIGKKNAVSDKDRMLSYRDEMYFDFYETRQFQFPQRSLYNHDPIYGNEAKVKLTDEEFRTYLFTMAARGTSFWELYYSHSMMNEVKWRINHSALRFIERNMDVLSHSVIFGGRPSEGKCYGYACFTENEGILCVRNSSKEKQSFTVKLDEHIGVSESFTKKDVCTVLPFSSGLLDEKYGYGDSFEFNLEGYETIIYHLGRKDKTLRTEYVHAENENTLEITFDDFVTAEKLYCDENTVISTELLEDNMTLKIVFEKPFDRENSYLLKNIRDITGKEQEINAVFDYNENGIAVYRIKGNSGFSIKAVPDKGNNQLLMSQGDEIRLEVDEEGYILFTVKNEKLRSLTKAESIAQVVAVRERNGVMKLYFDGELHCGRASQNIYLKGEALTCVDKVKVYDKALAFDEV